MGKERPFARHDALETAARTLVQQGVGIGEAIAKSQQVAFCVRQQRLQPRASLHERLLAEIAAVQFKQIEAIDARRHMSPMQQREKVRDGRAERGTAGCTREFCRRRKQRELVTLTFNLGSSRRADRRGGVAMGPTTSSGVHRRIVESTRLVKFHASRFFSGGRG
jgi:hypothetical protein